MSPAGATPNVPAVAPPPTCSASARAFAASRLVTSTVVNFDAVYGFKQTRENFDDRVFPFEGVRKDGAQEFNILR
jgi:hypothetical protein